MPPDGPRFRSCWTCRGCTFLKPLPHVLYEAEESALPTGSPRARGRLGFGGVPAPKPVLLPCPSAFPGILLLVQAAIWPRACAWQRSESSPLRRGEGENQKTANPNLRPYEGGSTSSKPGWWWRVTVPVLECAFRVFPSLLSKRNMALHP